MPRTAAYEIVTEGELVSEVLEAKALADHQAALLEASEKRRAWKAEARRRLDEFNAAQPQGRTHASSWYVKLDSEESKQLAYAAVARLTRLDLHKDSRW